MGGMEEMVDETGPETGASGWRGLLPPTEGPEPEYVGGVRPPKETPDVEFGVGTVPPYPNEPSFVGGRPWDELQGDPGEGLGSSGEFGLGSGGSGDSGDFGGGAIGDSGDRWDSGDFGGAFQREDPLPAFEKARYICPNCGSSKDSATLLETHVLGCSGGSKIPVSCDRCRKGPEDCNHRGDPGHLPDAGDAGDEL